MTKHPKDTAIRRTGPSAPLRWLVDAGYMPGPARHMRDGFRILDFGCGRGADVDWLRSLDYDVDGLDPFHRSADAFKLVSARYDVITCTYVLNVVLDAGERARMLACIRSLLKPSGVSFVTVRRDIDGDTASQRLIRLDFPCLHDGTGFATYRLQAS